MQIKFLTTYGSPIHGNSATEAQADLLKFWQQSLLKDQIDLIKTATIAFNDYSFSEYYDQEKLNKEIKRGVYFGYNHQLNAHYWQWAGKQYYVFEELYSDLSESHRLMELVITVEESKT